MNQKQSGKHQLIESPLIKELKYVSVKIERKVAGGENELLGTGTIILDGQTYYVLTAAHCFKDEEEKEVIYAKEDLELLQFYENKISHLEVKHLWVDESGDDVALITIGEPNNEFDYENGVKLYANELEDEAKVFGFTKDYPEGRQFKYEMANNGVWSNLNSIKETGEEPWDILRGTSGAGLFLKEDGVLLCMAFVKSTFRRDGKLNDIEMFQVSKIKRTWETALVRDDAEVNRIAMRVRCMNKLAADYMRLWDDLYLMITDGKDLTPKLQEIRDFRKQYPYPKAVYPQERVINLLFRQKGAWDDGHKQAFLMALEDKGQWIGLYGKMPEKANGVEDIPLSYELNIRADTLVDATHYELPIYYPDEDRRTYEAIIRAAFELDFVKMRELLQAWNPTGIWLVSKSILSNLFEKDEKSQEKLLDFINHTVDVSEDERYIASVAYNLVNNGWDKQLPLKPFKEKGLDSPADMIAYMAEKIGQKKEQVDIYGIHYSTLFGNEDQYAFPESLRVVQYLVKTGLLPSYKFTYLALKEDWLKIAKQMIHIMPYPIVFYTINYPEEKLVKRIGQELVYTDDEYVAKVLPDILVRLLHAIANEATPDRYYNSMLVMTQEMYVAVAEYVWYQAFVDSVMMDFCHRIPLQNVSMSDQIYKNAKTAISYIRDVNYRAEIFIMLLKSLDKNPYLVNRLIDDALLIDKELMIGMGMEEVLCDVIKAQPLAKIYLILYKCCVADTLSDGTRTMIDGKAMDDPMTFGTDQAMALCKLSHVFREKPGLDRIKKGLLDLDIWNCGIQGERYTDASPVLIEEVNEKVDWSREDWGRILANMRMNLELMVNNKHSEEIARHFNRQYISLLTGMRAFIKQINKRHPDYPMVDIAKDVDLQLEKLRGYNNIIVALTSEDHETVVDGTWMLWNEVSEKGVDACTAYVQLLISRVLLQKKETLETCLNLLTCMTNTYSEDMIRSFGDMLMEVLKKYSVELDYETLAVRVPFVFSCMKQMATVMAPKYGHEAVINHWLSSDEVNRYAGICV